MVDGARIRQLTRLERWAILQAVLVLPLTALGLRLVGLKRMLELFARLARFCPVREAASGEMRKCQARTIARMVHAMASVGPCPVGCLPRSLALWWLLRRRGLDSALRLGVRKTEGQFEGHAWVEYSGEVIDGTPGGEFVPFHVEVGGSVGGAAALRSASRLTHV